MHGNTIASGHGWKSYGNFQFELMGQANDVPATQYLGKGALQCYASRPDELIVWVMDRER